jgi:hypothetical protein
VPHPHTVLLLTIFFSLIKQLFACLQVSFVRPHEAPDPGSSQRRHGVYGLPRILSAPSILAVERQHCFAPSQPVRAAAARPACPLPGSGLKRLRPAYDGEKAASPVSPFDSQEPLCQQQSQQQQQCLRSNAEAATGATSTSDDSRASSATGLHDAGDSSSASPCLRGFSLTG